MSARTLLFRWRDESCRLDVPEDESPLRCAARHWRLPVERVTLVHKGRRYKHLDATVDASEELLEAPVVGAILVLGTRSSDQLDAPTRVEALARRVPLVGPLLAAAGAALARFVLTAFRDWLPAAWALGRGGAGAVGLFFSSMVPRLPARRRPAPPPPAD